MMKRWLSLFRRMTSSRPEVIRPIDLPEIENLDLSHNDASSIVKLVSVHGIGLGILDDGRAFLTQSGLLSFSDVAAERSRSISVKFRGKFMNAYIVADIDPHFLKKFDGDKLTCESIVDFVLVQAGHCVGNPQSADLQIFHERVTLAQNFAPKGRFVVPKELSDLIVRLKLCGAVTATSIEAIFAADQAWSDYWEAEWLAERFAAKNRHLMSYPIYVPGREFATQSPHSYPVEALGIFRRWVAESEVCDRLGLYSAQLSGPNWRWPLSVAQAATL